MNAAARTLVAILVALAVLPVGAGPVSAANLVHGTVTITGDTTTSVDGRVFFRPEGSLISGGHAFTNGSFSVSSIADGDYKIYLSMDSMDGLWRWYAEGVPGGVADAADATVVHLASSDVTLDWELAQLATLSGTVKDGDGAPLAGADVGLNRQGILRTTKTDGSGAYTFGYVQPGPITLYVYGPPELAAASVKITLPSSGPVVQDFVLVPKGRIEGTVTDAISGDPVEGIGVSASTKLDEYGGETTTDASGHYAIDVDPADYVLHFEDPVLASYRATFNDGAGSLGDAPAMTVASGATVTHDEALVRVDDPRSAAHTLGGLVTAAGSGSPLGGVLVSASHGTDAYSTTTDRWGRWALGSEAQPLPDQDYLLRAEQGWPLDILYPDLVPWFPEYFPNEWTPATATTITVAGDTHDGLDLALDRAARLAITVSASGTGTLHTGYRVVTTSGALAADVPATASSPASPAILLRPGTWKILVSGFRGDAAPGTRLLPQWLGGGVSLSTAGTFQVMPGQKLAKSITLPGSLRALTSPRIKGTPRVGRTLTATKGTWNLMTGTTFTFVWLRGTKVIGRTAKHTVVRADRGRTLKVRVTAINGTFRTTITRKISVP